MASARDNFVRLAEARTKKLLKDLDLLGNLSNRSNYSYTEDDVKFIFQVLSKKVQETQLRFKMNIQAGRDHDFRLPQ